MTSFLCTLSHLFSSYSQHQGCYFLMCNSLWCCEMIDQSGVISFCITGSAVDSFFIPRELIVCFDSQCGIIFCPWLLAQNKLQFSFLIFKTHCFFLFRQTKGLIVKRRDAELILLMRSWRAGRWRGTQR